MSAKPGENGGSGGGRDERRQRRLRLGGMALRNGLLVHGPTHWAAAVRRPDGEIEWASGPKPRFAPNAVARMPMLRGPIRLGESLAVLPLARLRLRSARLPYEDVRVAGSALAVIAASAAARRIARGSARREALITGLGLLPALVALRDPELAAYHGAEHKAIGGYETGRDPREVAKEHPRCGSNLIGPLLIFSLAGQITLERVAEKPSALARGAVSLLATGAAVEVFSYSDRHPQSPIGRVVHAGGHELQTRMSTREPTAAQLEVGEAAIAELLRVEAAAADSDDRGPTAAESTT